MNAIIPSRPHLRVQHMKLHDLVVLSLSREPLLTVCVSSRDPVGTRLSHWTSSLTRNHRSLQDPRKGKHD